MWFQHFQQAIALVEFLWLQSLPHPNLSLKLLFNIWGTHAYLSIWTAYCAKINTSWHYCNSLGARFLLLQTKQWCYWRTRAGRQDYCLTTGRHEQRERDKRKGAAICCTIEKFLPAKKNCTETSTSKVCAEQESCSSTHISLLELATTLDADQ